MGHKWNCIQVINHAQTFVLIVKLFIRFRIDNQALFEKFRLISMNHCYLFGTLPEYYFIFLFSRPIFGEILLFVLSDKAALIFILCLCFSFLVGSTRSLTRVHKMIIFVSWSRPHQNTIIFITKKSIVLLLLIAQINSL